ncbi:MAG: DUF2752 domain-containing protein [Lachnospiraceae bacterium]|nr:DUF2752 domain-containing protein [Lachnospiraceae bacterium]
MDFAALLGYNEKQRERILTDKTMDRLKEIVGRIFADIKEYGIAGLVFLGYYALVHLMKVTFCPLLHLTGIPCAGCGLTRAFLYMLSGQFGRAFSMNPMSYLIVLFVLYCGYFRYFRGTKIKGFTQAFVLLITVMLVFYAVRMYLYFPDRIPYVYEPENVLSGRIPGYENFIHGMINKMRSLR